MMVGRNRFKDLQLAISKHASYICLNTNLVLSMLGARILKYPLVGFYNEKS